MSFRVKCYFLIAMLSIYGVRGITAQQRVRTLRVLTYNLRYGERADIATLSRVVMKTEPDLVAMQEVEVNVKHFAKVAANNVQAISQFAHHTDMHSIFAGAFDIKKYPFGYGGGQFGNAILSKYSFVRTKKHTYVARGSEPRVALETVITLPDGVQFRFITTHLDHKDNPVRLAQVEQINDLFTRDDLPAILCGDFNERPRDPNGSIALLDKCWTRVCNEDENTFIAWNPTVKIDYVFCRPACRWRIVSSEVVDEPDASDHCPLLVVLELLY